jgi:hypothetical protein
MSTDDILTVADVAAELRLSERLAWETVKRLRVPCVAYHGSMRRARFKRGDWEAALERSKTPPALRTAAGAAVGTPTSKPKVKQGSVGEELSAWRKAKGVKA